jgi:hypothetical protein
MSTSPETAKTDEGPDPNDWDVPPSHPIASPSAPATGLQSGPIPRAPEAAAPSVAPSSLAPNPLPSLAPNPLPSLTSNRAPSLAAPPQSLNLPEGQLVGRGLSAPERKRLATAVEAVRLRVRSAAAQMSLRPAHLASREDMDFANQALASISLAANAVERRDLDAGWQFLHDAERLELHWIDPVALEARKTALASEAASTLSDWRKDAVAAILKGIGNDVAFDDQRVALIEATKIRDEHIDNVYVRNRLMRLQMVVISLALLALIVGFIYTMVRMRLMGGLGESFRKPDLTVSSALASMTLGGIGACLSALLTFASSSPRQSIPDHLANVAVTATRPLVGVVSGLVAILMLKSGVLSVPINTVAWVLPLVFGFSERLVMGALSAQGGKTS